MNSRAKAETIVDYIVPLDYPPDSRAAAITYVEGQLDAALQERAASQTTEELQEAQRLLVSAERSHTSNPEERRGFLKRYGDYVRKFLPAYRSFEPN